MKNFILILISIFTIGFISSCTKDNSIKPASVKAQSVTTGDKSDVGNGDGDTTPPPPGN